MCMHIVDKIWNSAKESTSSSNLHYGLLGWINGRSASFHLISSPDSYVTAESSIIFLLVKLLLPSESTKGPEKHDTRVHNVLWCSGWIHLSLSLYHCLWGKASLIAFSTLLTYLLQHLNFLISAALELCFGHIYSLMHRKSCICELFSMQLNLSKKFYSSFFCFLVVCLFLSNLMTIFHVL